MNIRRIPHFSHKVSIAILGGIVAMPLVTHLIVGDAQITSASLMGSLKPWVTTDRAEFRAHKREFRHMVNACKKDLAEGVRLGACPNLLDSNAFAKFVTQKKQQSANDENVVRKKSVSVEHLRSNYRKKKRDYARAVNECEYELSMGKRSAGCPRISDFQTEEEYATERIQRGVRIHTSAVETAMVDVNHASASERSGLQKFRKIVSECPKHLKGRSLSRACQQSSDKKKRSVFFGFMNPKANAHLSSAPKRGSLRSRLTELRRAKLKISK